MVAFINPQGGTTYVHENRIDEYKEAGFVLASDVIDAEAEEIEAKPAKKRRSKKEGW